MWSSRIGKQARICDCWRRNSKTGLYASETSTSAAPPPAAVSFCSTDPANVSTSCARAAGMAPGCETTMTATPRSACVSARVRTATPADEVNVTESTPFQARGVVPEERWKTLPAAPTAPPTALDVIRVLSSRTPMSADLLQKRGSPKAAAATPSSLARARSTRCWTSSKIARYWRLTPQLLPIALMLSVRCTVSRQPEPAADKSNTASTGICFFISSE